MITNLFKIPRHIAVIMDGNGRYAKAHGMPRTEGHRLGDEAFMRWVRAGVKFGVPEMSFYTFSTENWNRSPAEVHFLMSFSKEVMRSRRAELLELGVKVNWIGRKNRLWKSVLSELDTLTKATKNCDKMVVNFCINYGGRAEIVDATQKIVDHAVANALNGKSKNPKVTEKLFTKNLYSPQMPDVDLMIRTSGEMRTSNFLPWQLVYSEMIFLDESWPEVDESTLKKCLEIYQSRDRRFGGVK
jgi:undecaprenyl diphosphate synthase